MALAATDLLGQAGATGGAGALSITSSTFTPPNNSWLVVDLLVVNGPTGGSGGVADVRSGLVVSGGGLAGWQRILGPNGGTTSGYTAAHEIWAAPVTTGASMSVTVSHADNNSTADPAHAQFQVRAYTGYNTGSPVGATASDVSTDDASKTITLGAAPASTSIVFASRGIEPNASDNTATPGSGWTEIYDTTDGGYGSLQSQARGSSTSSSVDWSDLFDGVGSGASWLTSCVALEIVVAGAAVVETLGTPIFRVQRQPWRF